MHPRTPTPAIPKGFVSTIHVLNTGEILYSNQQYQAFEDRFIWVDRKTLVSRILALQKLTDDHKISYLVLYEEGKRMREYVNMDHGFRPLPYC